MCKHHKFGYCKYLVKCKGIHYNEECKDLSGCKSVQSCKKRHPKRCKKFSSGNCSFGIDCAYNHKITEKEEEANALKKKVEVLEKLVIDLTNKVETMEQDTVEKLQVVVRAMSRKVLSLESEIKNIKINSKPSKDVKEQAVSEMAKEKDAGKEESEEILFDPNDIKDTTSTPKVKKHLLKKEKKEVALHACKECNYVCKKEASLQKHMVTKHESHECKECHEKLSSFIELLKHVSIHHFKEQAEAEVKENEVETKIQTDHKEEDKDEFDIHVEEEPREENVHKEQDELEELEAELSSLKKDLLLK